MLLPCREHRFHPIPALCLANSYLLLRMQLGCHFGVRCLTSLRLFPSTSPSYVRCNTTVTCLLLPSSLLPHPTTNPKGWQLCLPSHRGVSHARNCLHMVGTQKALTEWISIYCLWITINCGKLWMRWEYQTTWPAFWETCMQVRKQQLELDVEQ